MKRFFAAILILVGFAVSSASVTFAAASDSTSGTELQAVNEARQALNALKDKRDVYAAMVNADYLSDAQKSEAKTNLDSVDAQISEIENALANDVVDYQGNVNDANELGSLLDDEIAKINGFQIDSMVESSKARGTVLPSTNMSLGECSDLMNYVSQYSSDFKWIFRNQDRFSIQEVEDSGKFTVSDVLACAVKTGDIKLWMVPYYVKFFLEFVLNVAGLLAVAGLVFGGYLYLFSGVSDAKEQGKKAILYAIAGYVMTLLAWAFVNIILALLTTL